MPTVYAKDGVRLYYEETGSGTPIIFVHEFAGDHRSWELQLRHFGRQYRCISFAARGFLPSDVPEDPESYSQIAAADDILAILDGLGERKSHIVGLSMGGFATLHFGLKYPERALSLCVGSCGYGSNLDEIERFKAGCDAIATAIEKLGVSDFAERYTQGAGRVQFTNKDPRGFAEFRRALSEHSSVGSAYTQRRVQRERPSLYTLGKEMKNLTVPTLVITGDEDQPCLEPGLFMKQTIPSAAFVTMPNTGHSLNLEEPDEYNRILGAFLSQVDAGRWPMRDPRSGQSPDYSR